uniref:BTB domain-containing protein n=1 Tax=Panagrolaimus davidi TaxID=227884 RepID=A0A914QR98_9BILA
MPSITGNPYKTFFLSEYLTITENDLKRIKRRPGIHLSSEEEDVKELNEYSTVTRATTLSYDKSTDNLTISLLFHISYDDVECGGNITFSVKSANHSVKDYMVERRPRDEDCAGFQQWFATSCSLTNASNPENKFLVDGEVTVEIKAMIFVVAADKIGFEHPNPNSKYSLAQLLWERDDQDFVISVGKKEERKTEVKIHRCVFASRSPVFNRMLENEMKEKAENRLEIIDFNAEIVKIAVEYFYDRDTYKTSDVDQLIDLLQFADKYDIQDLKADIEPLFMYHIYPETICQIANASIIYNSSFLQKFCLDALNLYNANEMQYDCAENLNSDFAAKLNKKYSDIEEEDVSMDSED